MIYIIKHREYNNPIPEGHIEYGVGELYDNKDEDNINDINKYGNEITGLYHIWKYAKEDIVGLEHYRRMFINKGDYVKLEDAKKILEDYDIITAPMVEFNMSLYTQLKREVEYKPILDKYIDLYDKKASGFKEYLQRCCSFRNREMFICKKEIIDKYCNWMFKIAIPIINKFINEDVGTDCNQRLPAHLIERLFDYWITKERLRVYEMEYRDI